MTTKHTPGTWRAMVRLVDKLSVGEEYGECEEARALLARIDGE